MIDKVKIILSSTNTRVHIYTFICQGDNLVTEEPNNQGLTFTTQCSKCLQFPLSSTSGLKFPPNGLFSKSFTKGQVKFAVGNFKNCQYIFHHKEELGSYRIEYSNSTGQGKGAVTTKTTHFQGPFYQDVTIVMSLKALSGSYQEGRKAVVICPWQGFPHSYLTVPGKVRPEFPGCATHSGHQGEAWSQRD